MAIADKEKAVGFLRERLDLTETEATVLAERAEELFLSETGRTQVPARALWLWVDLALIIHAENTGEIKQPVTSIKRGDTTIQYSDSAASTQPTGNIMDRVHTWRVVKAR